MVERIDWQKLSDRFWEIVRDAGGPNKASECITITFWPFGEVHVDIGTYSIGDWASKRMNNFQTEQQAFEWTSFIVDEAAVEVKRVKELNNAEEGYPNCG